MHLETSISRPADQIFLSFIIFGDKIFLNTLLLENPLIQFWLPPINLQISSPAFEFLLTKFFTLSGIHHLQLHSRRPVYQMNIQVNNVFRDWWIEPQWFFVYTLHQYLYANVIIIRHFMRYTGKIRNKTNRNT